MSARLLIPRTCRCIRSSLDGRIFARCARCRAAADPDFAERCRVAPPVVKPKRGQGPQKQKK